MMRGSRTTPRNRILPALVHIQANLDQDLSLDLLAEQVELSKYHFHRLFREATGETPKSYVDRLRLEWAALQLRIRRVTVLELALECGYRSHEAFSRAFRARYNASPDGDIACQRTPAGEYAVTDYVGSWDMGPAYESIFERLRRNRRLAIIGLPAIEIYRTTRVGQRDALARASIAIPVKT